MEIWKSIEGFEGLYEVSNLGRIRSISMPHPTRRRAIVSTIRKFSLNGGRKGTKYHSVMLTRVNPNIRISRSVHRLVAIAFVPNPENKPEVNHKDGDKTNNYYDNLEWCTRKENVQHSSKTGLLLSNGAHFNAKLSVTKVIQIKRQLANGVKQCVIAKKYNIGTSTINQISSGKQWKHVTI